MYELEIQVRPAAARDMERVLALLDQTRRRYIGFGREDLPGLLTHPTHAFVIAEAGVSLWGIACATVRARPAASGEPREVVWGYLRGLALTDGWRAEVGVWTLMEGLRVVLHDRQVEYLASYTTQPWLEAPLTKAGMHLVDHIVIYERMYATVPASSPPVNVHLRPAQPSDVELLVALDTAAFPSLWRQATSELIELLVTSGRFTVAEQGKALVGYACSDVRRGLGQVYRLAVNPTSRGQGIGSALLADALAYCQATGAGVVTVSTQQSNHASDRLYRRFGFRRMFQRVPVMVGKVTADHWLPPDPSLIYP
ncbi:MAG: GNAT family N-acetyltransferase [Anaerolineae bacterium]|nr:GNAT family N-acetyltransferase [Anaerolineae bacterium]MDW8099353.1 GNAT family N-acetyltransferase [Anaerolineae bacterium]